MNKLIPDTVVVIGCSFSRDSTHDDYVWQEGKTFSWPELLQQDLGDHYRVLNYSINGLSNFAILALVERLTRDFGRDALCFVIQFTRSIRQTFVKSFQDFSNLVNINNLVASRHQCMKDSRYLQLPYLGGGDQWEFNEHNICVAMPGKLEKSGGWLRTQYENNLLYASEMQPISDTLMTEAVTRQAVLLCERAGIPAVAYSYTNFPEAELDHLDFVVHRDFVEMEQYSVDVGLHMNTEGNRILLDRFIRPCIDTKI